MDDVLLSSQRIDWETPQALFDQLDREFGFTLDVCATPQNAKCKRYFTPKDDGLFQQWDGICWMNPPYGNQIGEWMAKAWNECGLRGCTVVCLIPSRTDTRWWHEYAMRGEIRFLKGRLSFTDGDGNTGTAPFPSAVVVFRPDSNNAWTRGE